MSELVLVSAEDASALAAEARRIVRFLDRATGVRLEDVAFTCSRRTGPCTLALVPSTVADLRMRLSSAAERIAAGVARCRDKSGTYFFRDHLLGEGRGRLAFVYSGVMGFYPDMLRDLVVRRPECRRAFDELEEALADKDGAFTPSNFIFPPAPCYRHDADVFVSGAYAEALVSTYTAATALSRHLALVGVEPEGVVGFAGGDLASLMKAGAAGEEPTRADRLGVLRGIYQAIKKAVAHAGLPEAVMLSVLTRHPDEAGAIVAGFPKDKATVAVDFSPRQQTLALAPDFAEEAERAFAAAGVRTMRLALDRPFNTPSCEKLVPYIRKFASGFMRRSPSLDVYSCATAAPLPKSSRAVRNDAADRWAKPVRFRETVRRMYDDGYRVFLEVGPRGLMSAAVDDTLRGEPHAAVAVNSIHRSALLQMQHALGLLAALGAKVDLRRIFEDRRVQELDFDGSRSFQERRDAERKLVRAFPQFSFPGADPARATSEALAPAVAPVRGSKAAERKAAVAELARRRRRFEFGALYPLVADAEIVEQSPGISLELVKDFRLEEAQFLADFAYGSSQLSYSDPNLKGLVPFALPVGAEIMGEAAQMVVPKLTLVAIEELAMLSMVSFDGGGLKLRIVAERTASSGGRAAVKVRLYRADPGSSQFVRPVMEATMVMAERAEVRVPMSCEPLLRPRAVHWSSRDIYPTRLCCGPRLRNIVFVESWNETGIDYEVEVPPLTGMVTHTRFPLWVVNPALLNAVAGGFALWRSHERFSGAFSFPFRLRRLEMRGVTPREGSRLKCYMRLAGVTPISHSCDILVTDGNGNTLMSLSGWQELTKRVPEGYPALILQPATTFLTKGLSPEALGRPDAGVGSAYVTEVPYSMFIGGDTGAADAWPDEFWLRILSHVILGAVERREFAEMTGSVARRTEWLFGRVAAKEAVRRYLKETYQARWSDADVQIWADERGKPHALGAWQDRLSERIDIAIAHTSQFVVAVAAANARVGVDVESAMRNLSEEFTSGVFAPEELELAAACANSSTAIIRFWCAKEAVSKALGTGIRYSPKEMVVTAFDPDRSEIKVRLTGAWAEAFKRLDGRDLAVASRLMHDHALATCFLPMGLFDEE